MSYGTHYASASAVQSLFFHGQTWGENTIDEDVADEFSTRVDNAINSELQVTTNDADTYGELANIELAAWDMWLSQEKTWVEILDKVKDLVKDYQRKSNMKNIIRTVAMR